MKRLFSILPFILTVFVVFSQELNCNIQVVSRQIQGTNKQIYETLQKELYEFINNKSWTTHVYKNIERIECNFLITLNEQASSDEFKGTLQIQSRRPVFNTNYFTTMFNYQDNDIDFRYVEFEPLEFNESSENTNLVSILAYYAYIIIGLDYDSFSLLGGTEYFEKAKLIVDRSQNKVEKGWKSFENRKNRYWIIENILSEKYAPVREFIYKYHRQGLDQLEGKINDARNNITESLKLLQLVYRNKPDPFLHILRLTIDTKSDEVISIFSESFMTEKSQILTIMSEIDPENASKYQRMTQSNGDIGR